MRQAAVLRKTTIRKMEQETDAGVRLLFTPLFNIYVLSWAKYLDNYNKGGGCYKRPSAEERKGQARWDMMRSRDMMRSTQQAQARGSQVWSQPRLCSETLSQRGVLIRAVNISKHRAYQVNTNLQTQLQIPVWKTVETEQRRVRD